MAYSSLYLRRIIMLSAGVLLFSEAPGCTIEPGELRDKEQLPVADGAKSPQAGARNQSSDPGPEAGGADPKNLRNDGGFGGAQPAGGSDSNAPVTPEDDGAGGFAPDSRRSAAGGAPDGAAGGAPNVAMGGASEGKTEEEFLRFGVVDGIHARAVAFDEANQLVYALDEENYFAGQGYAIMSRPLYGERWEHAGGRGMSLTVGGAYRVWTVAETGQAWYREGDRWLVVPQEICGGKGLLGSKGARHNIAVGFIDLYMIDRSGHVFHMDGGPCWRDTSERGPSIIAEDIVIDPKDSKNLLGLDRQKRLHRLGSDGWSPLPDSIGYSVGNNILLGEDRQSLYDYVAAADTYRLWMTFPLKVETVGHGFDTDHIGMTLLTEDGRVWVYKDWPKD